MSGLFVLRSAGTALIVLVEQEISQEGWMSIIPTSAAAAQECSDHSNWYGLKPTHLGCHPLVSTLMDFRSYLSVKSFIHTGLK
jgi:hypothetical protein